MKKAFVYTVLFTFLSLASLNLQAQTPPHPGQQSNNDPVNGNRIGDNSGAPIGEGTIFFLILSAAFALKTTLDLRPKAAEEIE